MNAGPRQDSPYPVGKLVIWAYFFLEYIGHTKNAIETVDYRESDKSE